MSFLIGRVFRSLRSNAKHCTQTSDRALQLSELPFFPSLSLVYLLIGFPVLFYFLKFETSLNVDVGVSFSVLAFQFQTALFTFCTLNQADLHVALFPDWIWRLPVAQAAPS